MTPKFHPLFANITITINDNITNRSGYANLNNEAMRTEQMQSLYNYAGNGQEEMAYRLVTYVHMALIQWMEEMEKKYADAQK